MALHRRNGQHVRRGAVIAALVAFGAASVGFAGSSRADVSEVTGSAYGHWTNVSLFGGPSSVKGPVPKVTLPAGGADQAVVGKVASASAVYGPATIFGGKWPSTVDTAPPSGPITASTKGTTGPGGSVTSTVDIVLRDPANPASPGGFGPTVPNEGDELHSSCTANESGVSGSVRFVNGVLATSTDESGEPKDTEKIPDNPPVNYTRTGQITNVGDNWKIIYNEQIKEADGSITVNAIHMYLLGPIAVGEQIVGQVRCGVRHVPGSTVQPPPTSGTGSGPGGGDAGSGSTPSGGGSTASGGGSGATGSAGGTTTTLKQAAGGKATTTTTAKKPTAPPSVATVPGSTDTSVAPVVPADGTATSTTAPESTTASLASSPIAAASDDSGINVLPLLVGAAFLVAGGVVIVPRARRRRLAGGEPPPDGPA